MPSTQRYLSVIESLTLDTRSTAVASVTVDGVIKPTILSRALTTLAARYPLLRSQIIRDDTGFLLRIIEGQTPTLMVHRGAEDVLLAELNTPLRLDRQVVRTVLSHDGTNSTITLSIDHSFADGCLIAALLNELLGNYTTLAAGMTPGRMPTEDFPPSLDTRLAGQFSHEEIATFITQTTVALTKQPRPARLPSLAATNANTAPPDFAVRNITFTAQTTTKIFTITKKKGLTTHGLICGAILAALRARLEPATEPITLAVKSPVNLRRRLIPPITPNAQLSCLGGVTVFVTAPHPADALALGRQITTQIHTAIDNGDPQKWILARNHSDAILKPSTSVTVSNLGRLATPPTPSGIEITASRFLTTFPEPIPLIIAHTASGRLTLDLVYDRSFLTDQQMADLANGIEITLGSVLLPC
jgi:phenolphthiocerol/phthiocerol/phthiodiolone dimycocerosyl transferase